jgi:LacI family transcriptional regulator
MAPLENGRRPTIKDVARLAGVSFKTVSRVVNGEPNVRADTRAEVVRVMEALGYAPNVAARGLVSQRSYLIGLLVWSAQSDYSVALQAAAQNRCRALGYHLVVETITPGDEVQTVQRLCTLGVDGVVVTAPHPADGRLVDCLQVAGVRHVLVSPAGLATNAPSVDMDEEAAGFEMTRHLIELGHRRIGFAGAIGIPAAAGRHKGYLAALRQEGLAAQPGHDAECKRGFRPVLEWADRLLDSPQPPTAIFAWNDIAALAVMMTAMRKGLQIPAQLSVAGFDDSPSASFVWPGLTTIRQPLAEMAEAAVDMLVTRSPPDEPPHVFFPFELIKRDSTAPPP